MAAYNNSNYGKFYVEKRAVTTQKDTIHDMQMERYQIFKAQDNEKGHFDLVVEIGENKIYVHKYFLASASETFNAMLSDRWNQNAAVGTLKIENSIYSYETFYELLTFIYSGTCTLTNENIFVITDMAEFYGILSLKSFCQNYLSKMSFDVTDIEEMLDFAQKYSLNGFYAYIENIIFNHYGFVIKSEKFVKHKKSFIEHLSTFKRSDKDGEYFFVAMCKWAEYQASLMPPESNKHNCVKTLLDGILSNINFSNMSFTFVKETLLQKQFLFSSSELYKIISNCKRNDGQEDECFHTLYKTAEDAVKKNKSLIDENFNLNDAIQEELTDAFSNISFYKMSIQFLTDFVVEKGFYFSFVDLYNGLADPNNNGNEVNAFRTVYQLAEKHASKKQELSPDPSFNLFDAIKIKLIGVLPNVKYHKMDKEFLLNFVVEKGFCLDSFDFLQFFEPLNCNNVDEAFKCVYEIAEKQVIMKQKLSHQKEIRKATKNELSDVISNIKFQQMSYTFLNEFIVPKGILSKSDLRRIKRCRPPFNVLYKFFILIFVQIFFLYFILFCLFVLK